jgi:hypothetical protein
MSQGASLAAVRDMRLRLVEVGPERVRVDGDLKRVSLPPDDGDALRDVPICRSAIASPSPHGRTLMIVFPLRRSVGLKAATASSRVATLPMFVRSRPSRTRRTISPS